MGAAGSRKSPQEGATKAGSTSPSPLSTGATSTNVRSAGSSLEIEPDPPIEGEYTRLRLQDLTDGDRNSGIFTLKAMSNFVVDKSSKSQAVVTGTCTMKMTDAKGNALSKPLTSPVTSVDPIAPAEGPTDWPSVHLRVDKECSIRGKLTTDAAFIEATFQLKFEGATYTAKENYKLYGSWHTSGSYQNKNTIGNEAYIKDSKGQDVYHLRCLIDHSFEWESEATENASAKELIKRAEKEDEELKTCIAKEDVQGALAHVTAFNVNLGFVDLLARKGDLQSLEQLLALEKGWPFEHGKINWSARNEKGKSVLEVLESRKETQMRDLVARFVPLPNSPYPESALNFEPVLTCKVCLVCSFTDKAGKACQKPLRVRKHDGALVCPSAHGGITIPECCHRLMSVKPKPTGFLPGVPQNEYPFKCSNCDFGLYVGKMKCVGCSKEGTAFHYNSAVERIWSARAYACDCRRNSSGGQLGQEAWQCVCGQSNLRFPPVESYY